MTTITLSRDLTAYRADPPKGVELRGAIVLIHEIWGLVPHITDVADRLAAEGYMVVAPDLLSGVGVTPDVGEELQAVLFSGDEATRTAAQPRLRELTAPVHAPEFAAEAVPALGKVVDLLFDEPGVDGRIAVMGFCFGGGYSFALAAADRRIRAAVPFYGYPPEPAAVTAIACPVLAFYGDEDERLMKTLPELTETMEDARVEFTATVYPGAGHAFFNDSNSITYREDAAADAWARTLAFLDGALGNA
ncbi:dienelactone hydrolase family protein [Plantibacter sp. YIM 135347]|uniref:dienelactone hydrolase family protein n=1 Tax=Plantibacter sp. YIM 135347 TaxID=3423919 RepID=UPI003D32591C